MPLTATAIRKAKPREKPRKLYDSRGLYLEIAPRGTKAWRFKYRFAGKEKRISMGIYPEVSLKLARQRRDEARKLLARDIDPSAYRKARKQSRRQGARNSFEAVATEWLTKHSPNWSTGWIRRLEHELGREVFPYIGASPVAQLTAPDLLAVVRRVEARGHLRKAHTVFQVCGRVLRYAVATGRAKRDVSSDLRGALPPVKTKHFAAITDPKEVGPLLRQLDTYSGTLPVRCALRLAPLVFVRLGELVTAEWDGIDLEGGRVALHGDEDRQAACGALGAPGGRDPPRGSSPDGAPPLRLSERAPSTPGTADGPRHALERVPGVGHPEGADDDARVPGDGAHDSGRGAGVPARLHRAPVGPRRQGSQRPGLQPDGVPARSARHDAGVGRLSGPPPGRGDRAGACR